MILFLNQYILTPHLGCYQKTMCSLSCYNTVSSLNEGILFLYAPKLKATDVQ